MFLPQMVRIKGMFLPQMVRIEGNVLPQMVRIEGNVLALNGVKLVVEFCSHISKDDYLDTLDILLQMSLLIASHLYGTHGLVLFCLDV